MTLPYFLFNDDQCSANGGDLVLLVLLDFSAAFDSTDHELLFTQLYDEVAISSTAHQ